MSIERVRAYFKDLGMERRVWEFEVSSATVELAAQALGVRPARIAKTLSFKMDDGCILIVAAGDARIDNAKYKARFHTKAKMLAFDEVEPLTGSAVGGVCPFALPKPVPVYLDVSLKRFHTVFPACGSDNSAIELTNDELYRYARAEAWIDVCKDWEPGDEPDYIQTPFTDDLALTDGEIRLQLTETVPADEKTGYVPAYRFQIVRVGDEQAVGEADLRLGYVRNLYFGGNIGYSVSEAYRGNRYAKKAVMLLLELARRHNMPYVIISCAPDNIASVRTIEAAGGRLMETAVLPSYAQMYREGRRGEERIYRFDLTDAAGAFGA